MLNKQRRKKDEIEYLGQPKQQSIIFQTPQMHAILKLKQKYEKNVQQAVRVIQDINYNKMPQKCLQHNNNYTLYCQNDQKPLCASCMYQNLIHKNHRVHPLTNCIDLLKRDCDKMQKQLAFIVDNIGGLVKHVHQGIQKLDNQFPHLVWKIQDSYRQLRDYLIDREKQHINQLKYYKERMKYQHGALSTQLSKIAIFIQQKIEQYSRKNQFQLLLAKRNIFDCLKNSAKIVGDQLNIQDQQQGDPKLNFQVFKEIQDFIYAKLPKLFTKITIKQEKNHNYSNYNSKRRLNSKSKQKFIQPLKQQAKQQTNNKRPSTSPVRKSRYERSESKGKNKIQLSKTPAKPMIPNSSKYTKTPVKKQSNLNKITSKLNIKNSPSKYSQKSSKKNSLNKSPKQQKSNSKSPSPIRRKI